MTGDGAWWYLNRQAQAARTHGPEESESKGGVPELNMCEDMRSSALPSDPAARAAEPRTWRQIAKENQALLTRAIGKLARKDAEIEHLRAMVSKRDEYLRALIDDEECRLDHHGYCQTHLLQKPCVVAAAREDLAGG